MTGDAKAGDDLPDEDLVDSADDEDLDEDYDEPEPVRKAGADDSSGRRYRPGRGGFDPEAAEMAARAKYAFRQRVVLGLILVVVVTAVIAGFVLPIVWWANGLADATLVGYLVYLRRQVRIEEEIRQRRLARFSNANRRQARAAEPVEHIEFVTAPRREPVGSERKPVPTSRIRRQAVVVDLEDEDPAFHELDEPGRLPYRRAVGE